ncbi:MAG: hypothetical protein GC154_11655 [bacterium]|nr:hypothetical protein [bacterium]
MTHRIVRGFFLITLAWAFVCAHQPNAFAIERPEIEQAAELAGTLVQQQPQLLGDDARARVDELNRALRELLDVEKNTRGDQAKRTQRDKAAGLFDELSETLQTAMPVVNIRIENGRPVLENDSPAPLPGDQGALLIHVLEGGVDKRFTTLSMNCSEYPEHRKLQFGVAAKGETWALIGLENVPKELTTFMLEMTQDGGSPLSTLMRVETAPMGRLKLRVLSSGGGEPVPAMIRLTWKTNGRDRKPANAIEIAPQMDRQGQPSGRRMAQLPGGLEGPYWCIPGPFDMEVPPGEWEVVIRRGVEHEVVRDSFTVFSGRSVEKTYTPARWIDMGERGWYSGDEHVHCRMQSEADAANLMAWVRAEDVHLANVVKMGDVYRTWFEQRGWGPDFRVSQNGVTLSPGQECPRTHGELGHTIHMNTLGMVRDVDKYFLYDWVFNEVHQQGGLSGFCHVLFNMFEVHRGMALFVPFGQVDYIEIMQFNQMGTGLYYDFLNLGMPLTAAAGSDVPWGGTVGEVRMYAYLGGGGFTPDAWFEAVRAGRTFVTNGPMLGLRVDGARPGETVTVGADHTLKIEASAAGGANRFLPKTLEIVSQGEVIASVENRGGEDTLSISFDWPANYGCWIAARATGDDGSQAHTTPVYVKRDGFRFWKLADAGALIDKRLASLQEVEDLTKKYRAELENQPTNLAMQLYVAQSPELMKRVEKAREYYANLRQTAAKETELRK